MRTHTITEAQYAIKPPDTVKYTKDDGTVITTIARTKPELLSGHTWVIWLHGISGCVALHRVTPTQPKEPNATP